ncbi:AtpZ/AtpI family protein [Bartonella sp. LJL80]
MAKGDKPVKPERGAEGHGQSSGSQPLDLETRRRNLETELARKGVLRKPEPVSREDGPPKGTAQAVKLSSEFLAGVIVGVVLGLGFDQLVGTSPWGLIIFLFLGFAAGVLNILRSVGHVPPSQLGQRGASRQDKGTDRSE